MIFSIICALVGYALLAIVSILDKYILEKALSSSSVYAFYSTIFLFAAFVLYPFTEAITLGTFLVSLISGLGFGFAMWVMFKSLKYGETTHVVPFIGAATAICTFALSSLVFKESFSANQLIGIVLMIIATALFAYQKKSESASGEVGRSRTAVYGFGFLAGLLFAISHVSAKFVFDHNTFITGFMWTKALVGVVGIFAYFSPSVRAQIKSKKVSKNAVVGQIQDRRDVQPKNSLVVVIWDKVLGVCGTVLIQYAIALGSVTVVNSLVGFQYAATFVLVLLVSIFRPKFLYEYISKKEYVTEIGAIILVVCGTYLLL